MVGAPALRIRNPLSLKRHLFLHDDRVKMLAQGFLDLFFDAAPHLEYFFQFFELSAKAAFAKAAFDTLKARVYPRFFPERLQHFGDAEGFFSLAIIAFGAFEFISPNTGIA